MRKKTPVNETSEEKEIREIKEKISNSFSNRSERISWNRKLKRMENLIEELNPIEDKILEIIKEEKYPLMDKIETLRQEMANSCVHPVNYLILSENNDFATCKFCNRKITFPFFKKIQVE